MQDQFLRNSRVLGFAFTCANDVVTLSTLVSFLLERLTRRSRSTDFRKNSAERRHTVHGKKPTPAVRSVTLNLANFSEVTK